MKRYAVIISIVIIGFGWINAYPFEFQPLGLKAMSMGGAGVAFAEGSFAPYYNPALLGVYKENKMFSLSAGLGFRENNIADNIDSLYDLDLRKSLDRMAKTAPLLSDVDRKTISETREILQSLSDGNGIQGMPTGSFGLQFDNFGFGVYGLSEAAGYANVDPHRLDIIVENEGYYWKYDEVDNTLENVSKEEYIDHSIEYALNHKLTYLQLKGLVYTDIPVSYGYQLDTEYGCFSFGGSLKLLPGVTYDQRIDIDTESGQLDNQLKHSDKYDTSWGIDLGIIYKLPEYEDLSFGLVAKNLNTPEFDTVTNDTIKVRPQVRFGVAQTFFAKKLTVALDADLSKNETLIPDVESQIIGGGVDYKPIDWFSVRGGVMRNLCEVDDGTIFTTGFGFAYNGVELDLSGQYSTENGNFQGNTIPAYGWIQVGIVYRFM
jgi:hypothetical protein